MTDLGAGADRHALVVSADPAAAEFLAALLTRDGFTTTTADVATAAREVIGASPGVTVVLVDESVEAVRSIRSLADKHRAAVPVVMLGSAEAGASARAAATDAGVSRWIARPVDDRALVTTVREIVARNHQQQS